MKKIVLLIIISLMVLTTGCKKTEVENNEVELKVSYASKSIEDTISCNLIYDAIEQLILVKGQVATKEELETLINEVIKDSTNFQVEIENHNCILVKVGEEYTYYKQGKIIIPI